MLGFMLRFFFFKQKTAYEMRISDWSSDVCSSDLDGRIRLCRDGNVERGNRNDARCDPRSYGQHVENRDRSADRRELTSRDQDRKSVVEGKSVSVRVDLGGRRRIKKKMESVTHTILICRTSIEISYIKNPYK